MKEKRTGFIILILIISFGLGGIAASLIVDDGKTSVSKSAMKEKNKIKDIERDKDYEDERKPLNLYDEDDEDWDEDYNDEGFDDENEESDDDIYDTSFNDNYDSSDINRFIFLYDIPEYAKDCQQYSIPVPENFCEQDQNEDRINYDLYNNSGYRWEDRKTISINVKFFDAHSVLWNVSQTDTDENGKKYNGIKKTVVMPRSMYYAFCEDFKWYDDSGRLFAHLERVALGIFDDNYLECLRCIKGMTDNKVDDFEKRHIITPDFRYIGGYMYPSINNNLYGLYWDDDCHLILYNVLFGFDDICVKKVDFGRIDSDEFEILKSACSSIKDQGAFIESIINLHYNKHPEYDTKMLIQAIKDNALIVKEYQ